MANETLFLSMSEAERSEWIEAYQQWLSVDFPKIENLKALSAEMRMITEQGLNLLFAFPYCRTFVRDSLRMKDYHRRMKTLRRYADKVTTEVQNMVNAKVNLTDPALLIPHVGRPTKEEQAAREIHKTKERKNADTLFGKGADLDAMTENDGSQVNVVVPSGKLPTLSELRWLMSEKLQAKADNVRDLRSRAEEASTRAKQMAEDGRQATEIEPYAKEAAECFEKVNKIYAEVDEEMATAYVRLKEDTAYVETVTKQSNLDAAALRTWLRPYWDKVDDKEAFKAKVIEFIKANDPKQAAIRKVQEEKKAQVDAILKYLQRKDKPNTQKRIAGMRKKLDELHVLIEDEADTYEPLLVAAKEDYEQNVKPAEEKKKAERAAKKKSKKTEA